MLSVREKRLTLKTGRIGVISDTHGLVRPEAIQALKGSELILHGGNQPVMDLTTRKVEITAQNHGFAVDADSLKGAVEVTHLNLNDNTVEGLAHRELPIFSVQYHPESSPGPHDADYLFKRFIKLIEDNRKN